MIILGPQAALARGVNGVLGVVRPRAGPTAVQLVRGAGLPRLRASAVHGAAALREPREARPGAARRGAGSRRRTHGSASGGSRSRCRCPASTPGAALVFIPALGIFAIPDILGGPDDSLIGNVIKQQFLETRDWPFGSVLSIVLTVRRTRPRGARRVGRPAQPRHAVERRGHRACVGSPFGALACRRSRVRVPLHPARHRRRLFVQRLPAERRMGRLHARLVRQALPRRRHARCSRQLARDRARRERSSRRCSERWPAWRCTATSCGSCRCWC